MSMKRARYTLFLSPKVTRFISLSSRIPLPYLSTKFVELAIFRAL